MAKRFPNPQLYIVNIEMKALKISHFFQKNLFKLQENLTSIFNNKKLKVRELRIIKEKLITGNQYKITCLALLKNNFPTKVIFQIHDNDDYFGRNLFALENLNQKEIKVPRLFRIDNELKIIYMEYLEGDFFYDLILRKKLTLKQIYSFVKTAASYLSFLHNFKFKKIPKFLSKKLNRKVEKIILGRTLEFIKPNIEFLRPILKRNLRTLLKKMYYLERINKGCLIHGDYQPANFVLSPDRIIRLMDFDTLEIGNPARDLGRFLAKIILLLKFKKYPQIEIEKVENLFLKSYFDLKKVNFYPNLKSNIDTYKAEMIQYIILSKMWGEQTPSFREIKKLINYQSKLLNL